MFSPIKCPCVRQEAVSLSLIQLQGKESGNDDRAEEVALTSTSWTHFQPLYLRKPQRKGELNSGKQPFLKMMMMITWETGSPCLISPESQIPSVVPGYLSLTTLHAQFNIVSLTSALICHSWTHWEINCFGFFPDYFSFPIVERSLQKWVFFPVLWI